MAIKVTGEATKFMEVEGVSTEVDYTLTEGIKKFEVTLASKD